MQKLTSFLFVFLFCIVFQNTVLSDQSILFNNFIYKNKIISCPKLTGRVVYPSNLAYQDARLVSNYYTSKNKYPYVVVFCQTAEDVQHAILWARCHDIPIRIRSGGHNHEGFSTGNGVIVIDVGEMKQIHLDKSRGIATVQPGVNNLELYTFLFKEGFTHVGGTCSEVALSGLVLSGGIGPLYRRAGLTCDTLLQINMIDADGHLIRATNDNQHQDLFWASRGGGGGNMGVITSLTIKVVPALPVTWFNIGWDWSQPIDKVILAWQDFFGKPDRQWFSHLDLWSTAFPKEKIGKEPIKVLGMFWGTPEEARRQLQPLLNIGQPASAIIEPVNWEQAIKQIEESTAVFITSKPEYYSPGAFVKEPLPPEAVQIITKTLQDSSSPLFNVLLFSLGGAAEEVPSNATAYYHRDAKFFINYSVQWLQKKNDKKRISEMHVLHERLQPYTNGDYVGNPDPLLRDYLKEYYGKNVTRLRCIKRKYDPDNVFRHEHSIPPASILMKCEG